MPKAHKIIINNRKTSVVTGVLDVLSFDLNEILLETEQGMLMVKGSDIHVNRLSLEKGEVDISGNIDSIAYSEIHAKAKQGESDCKIVQITVYAWSRERNGNICPRRHCGNGCVWYIYFVESDKKNYQA